MEHIYYIINAKKLNDIDISFLYENYSKLLDIEKREFVKQILDDNKIDELLLSNILKTYHPIKMENVNRKIYIRKVKYLLSKFRKAIINIEDDEWLLYEYPNDRYEIKKDEFVLENTIQKVHCCEETFIENMQNILRILNELTNCFEVTFKCIDDEVENVCYIILIFTD